MQTDEAAARALMAASRGEAYDKQLVLLLQRRKEAREAASASSPSAAAAAATAVAPVKVDASVGETPEGRAPEAIAWPRFSFEEAVPSGSGQPTSYAIVVATYNFRHLPRLSDKTKEIATAMFESLVGSSFNRFSRHGSKLLINPSVVEFQDAMGELARICAQEPGSSFFLFISTHGARISAGPNAGSYMSFSETRLTSEDELLLTAVRLHDLARMVHVISCKNKFVALELCQLREPTEKAHGEAPSIHFRAEEELSRKLYEEIVRLERARVIAADPTGAAQVTEERIKSEAALLNIVVMESCDIKSEIPVRNEDGVSNFMCRFNDAFRSGAIRSPVCRDKVMGDAQQRHGLMASEVLAYVNETVQGDAAKQNEAIRALYLKQVRTKYELAAEFEEIRQQPQIVGTVPAMDFSLGAVPDKSRSSPSIPNWVSSTLSSITLRWSYLTATKLVDLPVILGFEVQIRGHGRASESAGENAWKTAAALQVHTYEQVARNHQAPPTQVAVQGLSSDTAYCFRVRATTVGGWGPFSEVSPAFRTQSATSTVDLFGMVKAALGTDSGVQGVLGIMLKHPQSSAVQCQCVEVLAKLAIKGPSNMASKSPQLILPQDVPAVLAARDAMVRFKKNYTLQRYGCMLFGRLAANDASWRAALLSVQDPRILDWIRQVHTQIPQGDQETLGWCDFALRELSSSGGHGALRLVKAKAARRIQGMYRRKKAREDVRVLANSVYQRLVDPASGQAYFYNSRTGTASWSMPGFLQ